MLHILISLDQAGAIAMKSFGDRLREARKAAGLTQEQLGFALGVTKSSVSAWENNRETPSFRLLPALRGTLKRSLDELICEHGNAASRVQDTHADYALQAHDVHEQALLTRYRNLPARRREAVLELLKPDKEDLPKTRARSRRAASPQE